MSENSYSRISITLPPEVLAAADRLAQQLDRPRSWVVAEALRRFATGSPLPTSLSFEAPSSQRPTRSEPADRILAFARYDDYHAWRERVGESTGAPEDPSRPRARLLAGFAAEEARYLLVGEPTIGPTGAPNFTSPTVVLIEASTANAAAVLRALERAGFRFADDSIAGELAGCAAMVFGVAPRVDLLTTAGGIGYAEAVARARRINLEGRAVSVAAIGDLTSRED